MLTGFPDELLVGLHHHHTAEDDYLWPLLLQRITADAAMVLRMEEQQWAAEYRRIYQTDPA